MEEAAVRLYCKRAVHRSGPVTAFDEEECFTSVGRRIGVWLSTEAATGDDIVSADIAVDAVLEYEVPNEGDDSRTFIVPGSITSAMPFA